jgi:serine acetyltransferase
MEPTGKGPFARFRAAVRADHETMRGYEQRYGHHEGAVGSLARDTVTKIGLQMMVAIRWMRFLRDTRIPLGAKVMSRTIRHLYGSDVHWDAEFEPGVMLVHGMGLAISHAAHVGSGCILFHHVTLGMGTHPITRQSGAPRLEANVHVGPGATLIGPITIGEGSKIQAGALVAESVPPRSVVMAPAAVIRSRDAPALAVAPPAAGGDR